MLKFKAVSMIIPAFGTRKNVMLRKSGYVVRNLILRSDHAWSFGIQELFIQTGKTCEFEVSNLSPTSAVM